MQLASLTARFLEDHGELPPLLTRADLADQIKTEEQLHKSLQKLFRPIQRRIMGQLQEKGVPSTGEAAKIVDDAFRARSEEIAREAADQAARWGQTASTQTAERLSRLGVDVQLDAVDPRLIRQLETKALEFSADTMARIQGDVRDALVRSAAEGLGIDDAVRVMRDEFTAIEDHRLQTIARTEIQGAQNEAAHQTLKLFEMPYKQWLSAEDDRVRDSHVMVHGAVVGTDEPFPNGLLYPGDRNGPIEEWINCRCREVPYVPSPGEAIKTPYWP